jgi:serine phosphatase RsbU (regulator of sigma subunit)
VSFTPAAADLLESLPGALADLTVFLVDEAGAVVQRWGPQDGTAFDSGAVPGSARPGPGRAVTSVALPDGGGRLFATLPSAADAATAFLLARILEAAMQRERIEQDLESMNTSSLQLLEQVSMLGETLPKLSAGESAASIAAMGVKALVIAAGVERAVYVVYHQETATCEVLVHAVMDDNGQAEVRPYPFPATLPAKGLLAEVLAAGDSVVQRSVPATGALGEPLSPSRLARRQVIGVPVSYGSGERRVLLGALLVMDRRHTAYSNQEPLGSQEGQVAQSFAAMLGAVLGARKVAELGKELTMAQAIQGQILPRGPAAVPGFDLAGDYRTGGAVGGDYFDFVPLADGRTMAVIADVSGHDLASGMIMVSARATLRTLASRHSDPAALFENLAAGMHQDLWRTERFLTAAAAVLEPGGNRVEIVMAGHNELLLYRAATRTLQPVAGQGTILGFLAGPRYRSQRVELLPGDFLFLYTDGVTEAQDPAGEMFGEQRLSDVLVGVGTGSARAILDAVLAAVHGFADRNLRGDDMTLVVIKASGVAP